LFEREKWDGFVRATELEHWIEPDRMEEDRKSLLSSSVSMSSSAGSSGGSSVMDWATTEESDSQKKMGVWGSEIEVEEEVDS
jgi:hypothetical protein